MPAVHWESEKKSTDCRHRRTRTEHARNGCATRKVPTTRRALRGAAHKAKWKKEREAEKLDERTAKRGRKEGRAAEQD